MNTKYNFERDGDDKIVYVSAVSSEELPDHVREQLGDGDTVYSVHNTDGERLALVGTRELAFVLARQNDLAPVSVH